MKLWTLVGSKSAIGLLAIIALLVLSSVADAGIFRKRKCGTGRPASSCSTGGCTTSSGSAGVAVSSCPGGVCPIQR